MQLRDDGVDAHRAIAYVTGWINNADTKAGALLAVAGVFTAVILNQSETVGRVLTLEEPAGAPLLVGLLVISAAAVLDAYRNLVTALRPNVSPPESPNRFSFPSLAHHLLDDFDPNEQVAISEAWSHAKLLAQIVSDKYDAVRAATNRLVLCGVTYAVWAIASTMVRS
jgi:hypothetical protein